MKSQLHLFGQPENDMTESDRKTPKLIHADCLDAMRAMEADSIDAVVTDPPYGLEFMGKGWDAPWKHGFSSPGYADAERLPRPSFTSSRNPICLSCGKRQRTWKDGPEKCGCAAPKWDRKQSDEMAAFQAWATEWATEALRVAKPGAHLVAFGGTRTYHRLACAIEDAGWEVRDCLSWLYGQGFPKSLDVSKAIDKAAGAEREVVGRRDVTRDLARNGRRGDEAISPVPVRGATIDVTAPATDAARAWQGWGTALKPALEPIILARKPLVGTVAANVLKHGTGALNIDGCRIAGPPSVGGSISGATALGQGSGWNAHENRTTAIDRSMAAGRWPANVALDEEAAAMLDAQTGERKSSLSTGPRGKRPRGMGEVGERNGDPFPNGPTYGDSGGASRFFYTAKASRSERGEGNTHPTVKPIALMRWLAKLVCPPGGTILDPFAGIGTTLLAAQAEGFDAVGIEREAEYVEIARKRIEGAGDPK